MVIKVKYNGEWVKIPYLSSDHGQELVEEAPKDGSQYARQNGVWSVVNIPEVDFTEVYNAIDTKVDKVDGKGLSTNDYVTADKTKVTNINEVIEAAAKSVTATGISITLDKRNLVTNVVENIELNLPASTTALAGLMLPSDKTKLNGIAAGAEVNVNADWNATEGDALILNKPTLATVATSGSYDDLAGKPVLATVATSGSYNDLKDVPDPTLIEAADGNYPEDNLQGILLNKIFGGKTSITQNEYDVISSAIPVGKIACKYSYNCGLALQYGIGEFLLLRGEDEGEIYVCSYSNSNLDGSLNIGGSAIIKSDLSVISSMGYTKIRSENTDITIRSSQDQKEVSISLHTGGDGTKALMDDGKYRKLPVYGKNLLLGSGTEVSNSNYPTASYWLTESIQKNAEVTCTIWGDLGEGLDHFMLFNSGDRGDQLVRYTPEDFVNGKASKTFKWRTQTTDGDETSNTFLRVYAFPRSNTPSTIHKIKLEYGDLSTEWSPAWEDIPDLEERYAYGVEWDTASSNPDGVRVGNMQLHRELPIQSKIRGVILDNKGGIKSYLNNSNWGNINTEYLTESVMTEIPEHWYKLYQDGTKFRMMLSAMPLPGYSHIDQFYISSFESGIDRESSTLISSYGVGSTNVNKRGGDNTAEWDNTYRSLLGLPVTNLTRDQFRQAARKRGSGWEMYTYNAHKTLFWLFAVEYATLDSQKPFNAQKDANGFAQGGLGEGPTQMTDWTNFNNTNPLIPCGYTNEFGNRSGEKAYVVKNASGGTHATLMANRYRGIENPFGHIWKYTDGANIQVTTGDAGLSILWTTDDPSNFSDTSYTGYDKKGNICRTNGYAKKMLLGEDGDIVATEIGGSSSTYWCDYYYIYTQANRLQVVRVGGGADDGSGAGLACVYAANEPSDAARYFGSRLCFFPKYKSTEITTTTE